MSSHTVIIVPISDTPRFIRMRSPLCRVAGPDGTTSSADRNHLALPAGNGADHTSPIALAARGSVQSGFNEVALGMRAITGVARPHRSLQIPESANLRFIANRHQGGRVC
jgi:hypothetical protein